MYCACIHENLLLFLFYSHFISFYFMVNSHSLSLSLCILYLCLYFVLFLVLKFEQNLNWIWCHEDQICVSTKMKIIFALKNREYLTILLCLFLPFVKRWHEQKKLVSKSKHVNRITRVLSISGVASNFEAHIMIRKYLYIWYVQYGGFEYKKNSYKLMRSNAIHIYI